MARPDEGSGTAVTLIVPTTSGAQIATVLHEMAR
jgi:hypothetical protein